MAIYSILLLFYSILISSVNFPQNDGHGRIVSISLLSHTPSFLVQTLPFYRQLYYPCTPLPWPSSPLLLGPSISIAYTFFTNSSFSQEDQTISKDLFLTHSTTAYFTPFVQGPMIHLSCTFIALTLPSCHATCYSHITHFHTTHSFQEVVEPREEIQQYP